MTTDRLDTLLSDAEARARTLLGREEYDAEALAALDDLADVAGQAEDLLATVDVRELADAVDASELPEAVALEDVPAAIEDRAPRKAVRLRKLVHLADLAQVLDSTDVRRFRSEKDELEDELDDLTDDGEAAAGDGSGGPSGDGGTDGGGGNRGRHEAGDGGDGILGGEDLADALGVEADDLAGLDGDERSALLESGVRSTVDDAVGEFREGLLAAHERLRELKAANEERTPNADRHPSSANPTAVSTVPADRADVGGRATRHSTVPETVRHSDARGRRRVYGDRFDGVTDDG